MPKSECPSTASYDLQARRFLTVDLHCDAIYEHAKGAKDITQRTNIGHLDIPRMKEGGITAQVFAVWTNPETFKPSERAPFVHKAMDAFEDICRTVPKEIGPARTPDEMIALVESGRIAGILGIEGGHALEGCLDNIEVFQKRGVRIITLTWNNANEFADSCMEDTGRGLTQLGVRAVALMNRLGIIVDLSHSAPSTFFDALETSTAPVICSHSACRALCDHRRNLTNDQLKALAQARGLIGIVFLPAFLRPEPEPTSLADVLNHIQHAVEVAGVDSVALGSDFDGFGQGPVGLEDASRMPALAAGLRSRGFPEPDIRKILGENFLRVWREVEARKH
ncbi:MAG: dipeptidase [candidate division WOR-3 bacterium]